MTVFAAEAKPRTFNFQAGDVGYVPMSMSHFIENIGDTPLRFLELFRAPRYMDVSLAQWMALSRSMNSYRRISRSVARCSTDYPKTSGRSFDNNSDNR
jgi:oxalate decarboxylase/phosphoglucose isomerase-like protein (cupin superfamily)